MLQDGIPAGALPRRPEVTVNPADKVARGCGLNFQEYRKFTGICKNGAEQFLTCYCDYNFPFSPSYLLESCRDYPYCAKSKMIDPYNTIFDTHFYPRYILEMEEVEEDSPKSFVYLITDGNYVKIGVADNVKSRLNGIQTGNPNECYVISIIPCRDSKAAYSLEKKLHWEYRFRKKRGEWFDLLSYINIEMFQKYFSPEDIVEHKDIYEINS